MVSDEMRRNRARWNDTKLFFSLFFFFLFCFILNLSFLTRYDHDGFKEGRGHGVTGHGLLKPFDSFCQGLRLAFFFPFFFLFFS